MEFRFCVTVAYNIALMASLYISKASYNVYGCGSYNAIAYKEHSDTVKCGQFHSLFLNK